MVHFGYIKTDLELGVGRDAENKSALSVVERDEKLIYFIVIAFRSQGWSALVSRRSAVASRLTIQTRSNQRRVAFVAAFQNRRAAVAARRTLCQLNHCLLSECSYQWVFVRWPVCYPSVRRAHHSHSFSYTVPSCRTEYRKCCFLPDTVKDWDDLIEDAAAAPTLDMFFVYFSKIRTLRVGPAPPVSSVDDG